jgi:hypothetical protein
MFEVRGLLAGGSAGIVPRARRHTPGSRAAASRLRHAVGGRRAAPNPTAAAAAYDLQFRACPAGRSLGLPRTAVQHYARRVLLPAALLLLLPVTALGSGAGARAASSRTVAVSLREYTIGMPAKLRPGPTTFVIHNRGRFPHNFTAVYGPVRFHSGTVLPGATKRLAVTLVPGAYVAACTVLNGGHLARGMLTLFTIGSRAHGSAHWHYP